MRAEDVGGTKVQLCMFEVQKGECTIVQRALPGVGMALGTAIKPLEHSSLRNSIALRVGLSGFA